MRSAIGVIHVCGVNSGQCNVCACVVCTLIRARCEGFVIGKVVKLFRPS